MNTPQTPEVGTVWRFSSLVDETPEEIARNRFVVTAVDPDESLVTIRLDLPGTTAERRSLNDFLVLFEPIA